MNVAIYGAGGMGTILGAYITKAGYDIDLINRNKDHVSMLNKEGAKIIGKIEFIQKVKQKAVMLISWLICLKIKLQNNTQNY